MPPKLVGVSVQPPASWLGNQFFEDLYTESTYPTSQLREIFFLRADPPEWWCAKSLQKGAKSVVWKQIQQHQGGFEFLLRVPHLPTLHSSNPGFPNPLGKNPGRNKNVPKNLSALCADKIYAK